MRNEIEWKPSELPEGSVIMAPHPFIDMKVPWFKNEGDSWEEIGSDCFLTVSKEGQDRELEDYEIVALPPAWYEEFRVIPGQDVYSVNRAGQTRHRKYQTAIETGHDSFRIAISGRWVLVRIKEAVRRAFA